MSRPIIIPAWKTAPFIRLLLPLIAGILLQWYLQLHFRVITTALISFSMAFLMFRFLPVAFRFKLKALQGFIIQLIFISLGAGLAWQKDIRHQNNWYGNFYKQGSYLLVRIDEPLVEKNKSYKAEVIVESVLINNQSYPVCGKLLLYFAKDSLPPGLKYGDRIIISKELQSIKNSGNPGAFNYERYAAFQGVFHNVFLKDKDWHLAKKEGSKNVFKQFIFKARAYVLTALQNNIRTGKDELGIAQALLIGYTNDLDKDLVQAYSNTGVVHIIAVSGMHLALIYVLLIWIFTKIPLLKRSKLLQLFLILTCLWMFALLTGASPSVLRAGVMFSCIAIGKMLKKDGSIFNALAASAFLLLCYDPFFLWSVGFQLSYLAVLGILLFQKPIYNCFYIKNKWADKTWQLISVSTAAQLLTFPVCIYYFHQFPNLFLITNIVAVPLSGIILYAAITLTAFSWVPVVSAWLGKLTGGLTWLMNKFILWVNEFPFAVWDNIPATVLSTCLMYAMVLGFSAWLIRRNKHYLKMSMTVSLAFVLILSSYKWQTANQLKLIVYNVPRYQAIDLVNGNTYQFIGDSILEKDGLLQNFHLKPGRISHQLFTRRDTLTGVYMHGLFYHFHNTKIMVIDHPLETENLQQKIELDLIIISKNAAVDIAQLTKIFGCPLFVFDASNSIWKIRKWEQDCIVLNQPFYTVPTYGAFIYNIGI